MTTYTASPSACFGQPVTLVTETATGRELYWSETPEGAQSWINAKEGMTYFFGAEEAPVELSSPSEVHPLMPMIPETDASTHWAAEVYFASGGRKASQSDGEWWAECKSIAASLFRIRDMDSPRGDLGWCSPSAKV